VETIGKISRRLEVDIILGGVRFPEAEVRKIWALLFNRGPGKEMVRFCDEKCTTITTKRSERTHIIPVNGEVFVEHGRRTEKETSWHETRKKPVVVGLDRKNGACKHARLR
jgi:hypothetical protein